MGKSLGCCEGDFVSETAKIRHIAMQYCGGKVIEIGCGPDKIKPEAFGIDGRKLPGVDFNPPQIEDIYRLSELLPDHVAQYDCLFSSHCLEHVPNDFRALDDWIHFIKPGGKLFLYLPDDSAYDNLWNAEHYHAYYHEIFLRRFRAYYGNSMVVVDHGSDINLPFKYGFYLCAQKSI